MEHLEADMAYDSSLLLARALQCVGIRHYFGIPGVQNLRLYEALGRTSVEPLLVTNEQSAPYMAVGLYRATGEVGCVNVIGGPGVTHALPGLDLARRTHVPLFVLTTSCGRGDGRHYQLHDVDNSAILAPFCKATHRLQESDDIPAVVAQLFEHCIEGELGPCALEVPTNILRGRSVLRRALPDAAGPGGAWRGSPGRAGAPALPEPLGALLSRAAAMAGRPGVHAFSDLEEDRPAGFGAAVPTAIGAALSGHLSVALTSAGALAATGPELATARERRLPLVVLVHRGRDDVSAEVVARFAKVPFFRPELGSERDAAAIGRELAAAVDAGMPVVWEADLAGPHVGGGVARVDSGLGTELGAIALGLCAAGVEHVVGAAGDPALGGALEVLRAGGVRVDAIHDGQVLGFVAEGHSRASGRPSVLLLGEDWALSSVLSGVGESFLDQTPLVVVVAASVRAEACVRALGPLVKDLLVVRGSEDLGEAVSAASARSRAGGPGPVAVICVPRTAPPAVFPASTLARPAPPPRAARFEVDAVARMLCRAKQPLIFVGQGARACQDLLVELAEWTGSAVASTLSGKGVFPESHPLWLWTGLGQTCPEPLRAICEDFDGALVLGARLSELAASHYRLALPEDCYHVDVDPEVPDKNVRATGILSDARAFLEDLLEHLRAHYQHLLARDTAPTAGRIAGAHAALDAELRGRASRPRRGLDPYALMQALQRAMPADTIYATDSGNGTIHAAEALRLDAPGRFLCPSDYNSMGYSVPAAMGAARTRPGAPVVAIVGDGAFLMTGFKALLSEPSGPPLVVVVLRDGRLGMIADLQKATNRQPLCTSLPAFDVEALGGTRTLRHLPAGSPGELTLRLEEALACWKRGESALLECHVDADVSSAFFDGIFSSVAQSPLPARPAPKRRLDGEYPPADVWHLLERARREFGGRTAVKDGAREYTYADLHERSARLARFLELRGVGRGDVVGVMLRNRSEVLEAHFAAAGLRAVVLNVNTRLAAAELQHILRRSKARWLLASEDFAPVLSEALKSGDVRLDGVLWLGEAPTRADDGGPWGSAHAYEAALANAAGEFEPRRGSEFDPYQLYYTSGTTGFPKGVLLNQRQVFVHAMATAEEMRLSGNDVWGHFSPMFHVVDAFAIYAVTHLGGRHVIFSDPDPSSFLRMVEEDGITSTNIAAAAAHFLLNSPELATRRYDSLRVLSCGGSALDPATVRRLIDAFGCELFMSYGMTECCGKIAMSLLDEAQREALGPEEQHELIATSGRPFKLMDVRVVDDRGVDVPRDGASVGEVWIRGETVLAGYFDDPESTREAFHGGWFKTGDLATIRADGYLTISGRKKDMIISYGENVYAAEVERVLYLHPKVHQAAVYGVEHPQAGEVVKAVVCLKPGESSSARELVAFCRAHLAGYKVPQQVEFVREMPMSGTLKIDKMRLKELDARAAAGGAEDATALAPRVERDPEAVLGRVRDLVKQVSLAERSELAADATLWELGLDSILFLTLQRELERAFSLKLDPNFLARHDTIEKIATFLASTKEEPAGAHVRGGGGRADPAPRAVVNDALVGRWAARVSRELGAIETLLYESNRHGLLQVQPILEIQGSIDVARMQRAAHVLESRFPYLGASVVEEGDRPLLEYRPGRRLELVFLTAADEDGVRSAFEDHARDPARKAVLFVRTGEQPDAYSVVPAFWHCYMDAHGSLRLLYNLLEAYDRLGEGRAPAYEPEALPASREALVSGLGDAGPVETGDELALRTGQEAVADLRTANAFRFPEEPRRPLDGKICTAGAYRTERFGVEESRALLSAALGQRSSLTGVASASLCMTVRELLCGGAGPHRLLVMGSFDARPLLNLSDDTLGYYAFYPKFSAEVGSSTDFWSLARHFQRESQAYVQNRLFAHLDGEFLKENLRPVLAHFRPPLSELPHSWDVVTRASRLLSVNLGVLESRIGKSFVVRGVGFLQDFPSVTVYTYLLDGQLHVSTCSQLPSELAGRVSTRLVELLRQNASRPPA